MDMLNQPIQNLIDQLQQLPGVGPKTAERFAFYLMKRPKAELEEFITTLNTVKAQVKRCTNCFNLDLADPCAICGDSRRDQTLICAVAHMQDILALEKTGEYRGLYHVLDGTINMAEGITPDKLRVNELIIRIKKLQQAEKQVEVLLGFNATIEGETTSLYLINLLKPLKAKITRLARGLPQGSDLQYADEVTLSNALKDRREV